MENTFLATVQQEGEPAFVEESKEEEAPAESETPEKETPAESPTENKPDAEQPESSPEKEEDVLPSEEDAKEEPAVYHAFHEHPRWKAREEELKQLQEKNEELFKFQEWAKPLLETKASEREAIPQWFSTLYGDNEDAWRQYQNHSNEERTQILEAVKKELKPFIEVATKTKEKNDYDSWADKEWKSLESDTQVQADLKKIGKTLDKPIQEEIAKIVSTYLPTDQETGNLSIRKGYELWKQLRPAPALKPASSEEKKLIADKTIKKTNVTEEVKDYATLGQFRGKSISDLLS